MNPMSEGNALPPEELLSLLNASHQLVSHLDLEDTIERILHEAVGVVRAQSCSVILRDPTFDEFYFYAASGPQRGKLAKSRFDAARGIAGRVLRSGCPAIVDDAKRDPDHYDGIDAATGVQTHALLCVPLKARGETIGVLEAVNSRQHGRFSERDLQMLALFANFAGCAIQNARMFEQKRLECQGFQSAAARQDLCLGSSEAMHKVWDVAERAAATKCTILVTGETGVGKEVVASYIHQQSPRRDKPFICVNCAAIDENLLNSELFGHEKGAFTGAIERRIGRFEMAHSGTLFLDEITECSPATQARLLRVLQEQAFERIGGNTTVRTDARIIVSSNADIQARIAEGRFREDLFHRLNVVSVWVPPLRQRPGDIPELVDHFVAALALDLKREPVRFSAGAMDAAQRHTWPGNVRELRNLVERVMVLHITDQLAEHDLPNFLSTPGPDQRAAAPAVPTGCASQTEQTSSLWDTERRMIEEALAEHNWNQTQAARALGITRHHLRYRIKKFGLAKPPPRAEAQAHSTPGNPGRPPNP